MMQPATSKIGAVADIYGYNVKQDSPLVFFYGLGTSFMDLKWLKVSNWTTYYHLDSFFDNVLLEHGMVDYP